MNAINERPKGALLADLLPYEAWDPDLSVLWLKDGSATQTFAATPKNNAGMIEDDLAFLRSGLTAVLNQIPEKVSVQFFLIREKSTPESDLAIGRWTETHQGQAADQAHGSRSEL